MNKPEIRNKQSTITQAKGQKGQKAGQELGVQMDSKVQIRL